MDRILDATSPALNVHANLSDADESYHYAYDGDYVDYYYDDEINDTVVRYYREKCGFASDQYMDSWEGVQW